MYSIEEDKPSLIYKNLIEMIKCRSQVPNDESLLTEDKFNQTLSTHRYVIISATRPKSNIRGYAETYYIIIAPNSTIASRTSEFKKMIGEIKIPKDIVVEIMIISENDHNTYIGNFIKEYTRDHRDVRVMYYTYNLLIENIPLHVLVPKHSIATEIEKQEYFKHTRSTPNNLSKILITDPVAIWYDFQHGMVIRIDRLSDSAGHAISYRLCC